jgi:frataxin-like iron-binding protein CyaY
MMSKLSDLITDFNGMNQPKARLYFVTRVLKSGFSQSSKKPDKYNYNCHTININGDIEKELLNVFSSKLNKYADETKFSLEDYAVVTDDSDRKVLLYKSNSKIQAFRHIVENDIPASDSLPAVLDLSKIAKYLWAYIIEVIVNNKSVCALKKMSPSKILVAEEGKGFNALFTTKEKSLVLSHDQSIIFDRSIDALYLDKTFYIIQKNNFEEIVGLESEYREEALAVADKIFNCNSIILNYKLRDAIENKKKFIRKLTKIKNEIDKIDNTRIQNMRITAQDFNLTFNLDNNGKIVINNENDMDTVIKLLDDSYLNSKQTGRKYEASVKKEMQ